MMVEAHADKIRPNGTLISRGLFKVMARHDYRGAEPETTAALKKFVGEIAYEMHVEPQYLYAILSGAEPDPFKRFLHIFRAVCRKNPEGARGFIAKLSAMLRAEEPHRAESVGMGDATRTFSDLLNVAVEREEGMCSPEKLEAAKERHVETVAKVTVYSQRAHLDNAGG
jgi:hypothetical protein